MGKGNERKRKSVGNLHVKALGAEKFCDAVEFFGRCLEQSGVGSRAVNSVNHDTRGTDATQSRQPRQHELVACVVHVMFADLSFEEHGLNDDVSVKYFQSRKHLVEVVGTGGSVHERDVVAGDSVELLNVVINLDSQEILKTLI